MAVCPLFAHFLQNYKFSRGCDITPIPWIKSEHTVQQWPLAFANPNAKGHCCLWGRSLYFVEMITLLNILQYLSFFKLKLNKAVY